MDLELELKVCYDNLVAIEDHIKTLNNVIIVLYSFILSSDSLEELKEKIHPLENQIKNLGLVLIPQYQLEPSVSYSVEEKN